VTGHPIPAVEKPRRPGDPAELVASSESLQRVTGWRPKFPDIDSIVASAWNWHRSHPRGFEG
jgi:UDP-glucose 4-epimerase